MSGWTKLFSSIVTSSVWCEDHATVRVWIAMLATADAEGIVEGAVPGFANLARVTVDQMRAAVEKLSSPDPDSRTPDHEGHRIEVIEGGWRILNYHAYRERAQDKEGSKAPAMRRYRARRRAEKERGNASNALPGEVTRYPEERRERREAEQTPPPTPSSGGGTASAATRSNRKRSGGAVPPDTPTEAPRFVEAFNRTFDRRVSLTPKLARDFAARVADGYAAAMIVALPLLVDAQGLPDELRKKLEPSWLLRNGERGYTTRDGERRPGKAWVEDALQRADQTRLWPRHLAIAREAGCLDELRRLGCRISEDAEATA